ncbi:phytanoyl-CoA dioxygenase family protein [Paenibacillus mendelii]|uniref:Phytanoyl-CoA dioxygenase family protein n=1 Tax=Paenibacillus mendelii TaxID=206163 RepID=A0ABV6J8D1_9BACL|nr:phytanoyl-CoA dioxygenase family protein [Paenibacillus mendelii]MCQ6559485.1 phytanoyl-CoA dioxygenase family protein [Paenibacillus mendelii]
MSHILSTSDINFYRTHHYLHAKQVVPQEVLDLGRTIISRWVDELINKWVEKGLIHDTLPDLDFQHRLVKLWNAAGRPKYERSPRRDLVGPDMYSFLAHPRLLDLAADLLGTDELSVHGIFNSRPKLPDQKWTDTPWHQDAQYYRDAEKVHVVSIWIPLQKVTEHNSCLQVAPDLFTDTLLSGHDDEETGFLGLSKEDAKKLRAVSIEMEPGDALCFTQLLPHRALPNRSDAVRWSMDIRYEATSQATASGKAQGFVARSLIDPDSVETYKQWEPKWAHIPRGGY